jgi:ribosome-associated heat shock protein Hsp15
MDKDNSIRIDKFLWSVRIFKTRSSATEECKKGRILIDNVAVKPSRNISKGELISVRKPPAIFSYRVIELPGSRVSAKLVTQYLEDLTPESEKIKLSIKAGEINAYREKGTGRPTKRERRLIDRLREDSGLN